MTQVATRARGLGCVLTVLCALAVPAAAARGEPFKVEAFAGSSNWPFWVAQDQGFFRREELEVALDITPNLVAMARDLQAGRYDLALTSPDDVVAHDEGHGEVASPGPADFVLTAPRGCIARDLTTDRDGVRTVLALRSRYAAVPRPLSDPKRYIDDSVSGAARASGR